MVFKDHITMHFIMLKKGCPVLKRYSKTSNLLNVLKMNFSFLLSLILKQIINPQLTILNSTHLIGMETIQLQTILYRGEPIADTMVLVSIFHIFAESSSNLFTCSPSKSNLED